METKCAKQNRSIVEKNWSEILLRKKMETKCCKTKAKCYKKMETKCLWNKNFENIIKWKERKCSRI